MATRRRYERPEYTVGEAVRVYCEYKGKHGSRRATLVSLPEGWRHDAMAKLTARLTSGEEITVHWASFYANY